ncbi:energy transducer TonB [Pedobacter sp. P351]|uniref:energy transducer TonB n=1 Tax=Pedobacter superstes TaxID=3133441 RepID=UPI0030ABF059
MMENEPLNPEEEIIKDDQPAYKDRSLLYMGLVLAIIIAVMGYLTLFVDDPSKIFGKEEEIRLTTENKSSLLNESESMTEEEVRKSLIKFIEAFYFDQRRGYFDPPSYFANITETFYNYHNLTHKRLREIYWRRLTDMENLRRNWIVSSLDFVRRDSRIIATYWTKESYLRPSKNENYSASIKYELIIDETGKIVSLREAEIKNVEIQKLLPDSSAVDFNPELPSEPSASVSDKLYDFSLVDVTPEFIGGQKEFARYVENNLKYPQAARQGNIQGKVYLSFIVEKDGRLTDIKIKQGLGGGCDEEAIRLLRNSPKWKPGLLKDVPVRTFFVLPVTFQL